MRSPETGLERRDLAGRRPAARFLAVALLLLLMPTDTTAEPQLLLRDQTVGDDIRDILAFQDIAWVGGGRGLYVFDIADPTQPEKLSFLPVTGGILDLERVDHALYAATSVGVQVFSLANFPEVSHFDTVVTTSNARRLHRTPDRLYVADSEQGLVLLDLTGVLLYPATLAVVPLPGYTLTDARAIGSQAYLVATYPYEDYWQTALLRANVDPPSTAALDPTFPAQDVAGAGFLYHENDILYLPTWNRTELLQVPSMTKVGELPLDGLTYHPDATGLWVDHSDGLSRIENGVVTAELELAGSGWDGHLLGDHFYRAAGRSGVQIVDVGDPSQPTLVGAYADPQHLNAVVGTLGPTGQQIAYAVGRELFTLDVSVPGDPRVTDRDGLDLEDGLITEQGVLVVSTLRNELRFYDLADPAHPALITVVSEVYSAGMVERGGLLYVADQGVGLRILDVRHPELGVSELGEATQTGPRTIALAGDFVYLLSSDVGGIFDVSDPSQPIAVGTFTHGTIPRKVLAAHGHLYFATDWYGSPVYSLADPLVPVRVLDALPDTDERIRGFDVEGIYLAVAHSRHLRLYDVRDGGAPLEVASVELARGTPDDVDLRGDRLHLATGSGYFAYDFEPPVGVEAAGSTSLVLGSFPNPARGMARIYFRSPRSGPVDLRLYDTAGRLVRQWSPRAVAGDRSLVVWDGRDTRGRSVGRGIYHLRLEAAGEQRTHRLVWER